MNLLGCRYAPITDVIGFLEADFTKVVSADVRWRGSLGGYRGRPVGGSLSSLLEELLPLTGPLLRYVWVETTGPWTAYFDNFVLGSDPFGPMSYLAKQMGCRSVAIGCRQATDKRGASVSFSLYGPIETDWVNEIRSVAAVQDTGRWEWVTTGTPQPFEDVVAYNRRRVRDRFTPDMLVDYCSAMGIRPFDESFFGTAGHLVENTNITNRVRSETLQQARAWHGLE